MVEFRPGDTVAICQRCYKSGCLDSAHLIPRAPRHVPDNHPIGLHPGYTDKQVLFVASLA